ncbi:hypothetical protein HYV89_01610 [Candidatus Woesearchaeota archaeon]|nr:hypothetical protein [Candidatus Woesearchaeota archaeon]
MKSKILALSALSVITAETVRADCFGSWGMMGGGGYESMWFFGLIFQILVVIALVLLILWLIKQLQNPKHRR